jgi:outer membrane biosynthesis protein TonB
MEKQVRFGLLATLALHILPAGIWWWGSMQLQTEPSALPREQAIEVQLRSEEAAAKTDNPETVPEAPAAPAGTKTVDTGGPIAESAESNAAAGAAPLLPAEDAPYVPAGELDTPPRPQSPIIVPFPDAPLDKPKVSGVLVLYIGTDGTVERIEVDRSDLPLAFERVAIETFMAARMQPGIKAGKASRARMKVVVEFAAQ